MRFRRNPLVHIFILIMVAAVAVIGVRSDHFGIGAYHRNRSAPTPVPTPIPVAEQAQLLKMAITLRQQGRYDEAIQALEPVIASNDPEYASASLLETAKDQIALNINQSAEATIKELRAKFPDSTASDEAQFHLGQIEASRGDLVHAISDLDTYRKRHPGISVYIDLLIAQYQEQRGNLSTSAELASSVASSEPIARTQVDALELMRGVAKKQKNDAAYLEATNRLISLATIPSYLAELIYERAGAELRLGQKQAAINDLRTVLRQYSDTQYAINAVNDLSTIVGPSEVTREQRALVDYYRGSYQSALEAFTSVLTATASNDRAWYYRAMSRLRTGDDWTAAVELRAMADRFPSSSLTPGALYTAGKLFEGDGDLDLALSAYEVLIQDFSSSVEATDGRLRTGLVLYERGDYTGAVAALTPVRGTATAEAEASFWEGKALQQIGQHAKAVQAWTYASEIDPTGYYGLRATELMAGNQPVTPTKPQTSVPMTLSATGQEDLSAWYAEAGTTSDAARVAVQQEPGYQRMSLLFGLGMANQANWEMSALADKLSSNPALLAALGQLLDDSGEYNAAYRVGIRLQTVADNSAVRLPLPLQRLAYPLAYPGLIQTHASALGIDPLLFLALIRQESGYDPAVTSSANAKGLAQVVPSTAVGLAKTLDVGNFTADMLYRPAIAVQFGERYLADRLARYHGQIYPALAGYNAGDGNVDKWLTRSGAEDPDLFVEQIPFPETHNYVQIVYANYLNYVRIYR